MLCLFSSENNILRLISRVTSAGFNFLPRDIFTNLLRLLRTQPTVFHANITLSIALVRLKSVNIRLVPTCCLLTIFTSLFISFWEIAFLGNNIQHTTPIPTHSRSSLRYIVERKEKSVAIIDEFYTFDLMEIHVKNLP